MKPNSKTTLRSMVRPKNERPSEQLSVRVDADVAMELDAVTEEMRRANVAGVGKRVDVLRAAIVRGLRVLREEIAAKGVASEPRAKAVRKSPRG